jgi:proline iminopeptidase
LQWRPDFSPTSEPAEHALTLWNTRPPEAAVNVTANRELWADRGTEDLRVAAARVTCPVTMLFGADDPRPWTASDSLLAALPNVSRRIVFQRAGHAPWAERPADTRHVIIDAIGAYLGADFQALSRSALAMRSGQAAARSLTGRRRRAGRWRAGGW